MKPKLRIAVSGAGLAGTPAVARNFGIGAGSVGISGQTITYVNSEAMSAGAFISATTGEIWFAPAGVIGGAAPVQSTGQDVEATMKQKIVAYLKVKMRATSEGKGYRGEVISAMIDADKQLRLRSQRAPRGRETPVDVAYGHAHRRPVRGDRPCRLLTEPRGFRGRREPRAPGTLQVFGSLPRP